MHLSLAFRSQSSTIWRFEVAIKTGSRLCRIAVWECFRRRILARLRVLCNLLIANKASESPRHFHNAIRHTAPNYLQSTESGFFNWADKQLLKSKPTKNLPKLSKSVGRPELKAGPIPDGFAGVLVRWRNNLLRCSYHISVTYRQMETIVLRITCTRYIKNCAFN